ncbi:MAG: OadG family protein [Treponemataceae bacterium]|nr:OadG family protein [Treponemataceae bacterium]
MTIVDMLGQSGLLTLLGMGVVFGFLIIMIIFVTISTKIIKALGLDKDKEQAKGAAAKPVAKAQNNNAVVAAIAAAAREKKL